MSDDLSDRAERAVRLDLEPPLAWIVLNQPERRNALNEKMWAQLPERLKEAEAREDVKVVIVCGEGKAFAAGADISEFESVYQTPETTAAYQDKVRRANEVLANLNRPTIAMIRGACVGGGCGLALACDVRFAAEGARLGITPAKLGLAYSLSDSKRLVDAVGLSRARDMLFTGRLLETNEALRIGLVDRVVPAEELNGATRAYAATLTEVSQFSIRQMKTFLAAIRDGQAGEDEASWSAYLAGFSGEDFKEGYTAFNEKRSPDFKFK